MTEQEQNEAICEWLGWLPQIDDDGSRVWWVKDARGMLETPTFRTGNDMLMLMNALRDKGFEVQIHHYDGSCCHVLGKAISCHAAEAPDAVRAAVLAIIGDAKP